jgi:hypothetical protein
MDKNNLISKVLSEAERTKLERLSEDTTTLSAIKKVLLFGIYYNGTLIKGEEPDATINFALGLSFNKTATNEQIGADLRACTEGIRLVESGFKQLESFKKIIEPETSKENPAR